MKKRYILGLIALSVGSCKPNLKTQTPQKGNADFSVYLAVGNSLTAGYADGSLYYSGQLNSYPNILATQFKTVGGGNFKQPLLPVTCEGGLISPKFILGLDTGCDGTVSLTPVLYEGGDTTGATASIASQGPFNNVGVPGIRVVEYLLKGYAATLNAAGVPYANRFYADPINETPLDEALRLPNVTFFTCWLGANDVLLNAVNGGVQSTFNNGITPLDFFAPIYDSIINSLTKNGAKGVLINVPDITAIPYFTTIPINGLSLTQAQADGLNATYAAAGITTHFTAGVGNLFMVEDANGNVRQATSNELVILPTPQDSIKCAGWGSTKPIPNTYVLTTEEIDSISQHTIAYNQVIMQAAQVHHLAYVDMYNYLHTVASGILFNGVSFNAQFVSGGTFSLDGIHLTPRGYALVANYILQTINSYYGSTIPMADINKYSE